MTAFYTRVIAALYNVFEFQVTLDIICYADAPLFWADLSALIRCMFVIITTVYLYICDHYHFVCHFYLVGK